MHFLLPPIERFPEPETECSSSFASLNLLKPFRLIRQKEEKKVPKKVRRDFQDSRICP
jgi:hypothetical protein